MKPGTPVKIHLPSGFHFSASSAGIKVSGRPDLALAACASGTTAAALFTSNRVVAAPIEVGRESLVASRGRVRALIVNSGNANCATGVAGVRSCKQVCSTLAHTMQISPREVFPSSTGIIGVPLPVGKIVSKLSELVGRRTATQESVFDFAHAIMTTDTRPKLASARVAEKSRTVHLMGIAKGSGMIHPQLATMLVFLFTDVAATTTQLRRELCSVADETFNCISVDGDTSTNDTVLLMASGQSGVDLRAAIRSKFHEALRDVCRSLSEQIVADGEGVQHVVRLSIEQARNRDEGMQVARTVAHSLLVKTAFAGADPNWGRILAAVGRAGIPIDPGRINISIGDELVCRRGKRGAYSAKKVHAEMSKSTYEVRIQLGRGQAKASYLTTDLTKEYVHINAEYST
ncbi:MAG: bifunctional glutamate N-acetyltransferase/amino-acid acetyltransferase ArgJ [Acidobacteriaceae bacterium]|nr:bifunctional glutamate N-acetyltransferase/amino-acid acetyltransferase ArgJ [Acidobacteriaceae bacterium]